MQIFTADATIIWYTPPQSGHFSTSIPWQIWQNFDPSALQIADFF